MFEKYLQGIYIFPKLGFLRCLYFSNLLITQTIKIFKINIRIKIHLNIFLMLEKGTTIEFVNS